MYEHFGAHVKIRGNSKYPENLGEQSIHPDLNTMLTIRTCVNAISSIEYYPHLEHHMDLLIAAQLIAKGCFLLS